MKCHFIYFSILISLVTTSALAGSANVNWPVDYKQKFTHYFSGDRTVNNNQVIRLYANDAAIAGVHANGKLPNGSVVVGELYAAQMDDKKQPVLSGLGRRIIKNLAAIVVMQRGDGFDAEYPDELKTGNWEFAVFSPTGQRLEKDITACRACHHPLTDKEFLFSYEHLR